MTLCPIDYEICNIYVILLEGTLFRNCFLPISTFKSLSKVVGMHQIALHYFSVSLVRVHIILYRGLGTTILVRTRTQLVCLHWPKWTVVMIKATLGHLNSLLIPSHVTDLLWINLVTWEMSPYVLPLSIMNSPTLVSPVSLLSWDMLQPSNFKFLNETAKWSNTSRSINSTKSFHIFKRKGCIFSLRK